MDYYLKIDESEKEGFILAQILHEGNGAGDVCKRPSTGIRLRNIQTHNGGRKDLHIRV